MSIEADEGTLSDECEGTAARVKVLRSSSKSSALKYKFRTLNN